jgi:hypothetical protein
MILPSLPASWATKDPVENQRNESSIIHFMPGSRPLELELSAMVGSEVSEDMSQSFSTGSQNLSLCQRK